MRIPLIAAVVALLAVFSMLGFSKLFNDYPATTIDGKVVTQPVSSGSAFMVKYVGAYPDDLSDADRKAVDATLFNLLKQPYNLRNWQLCKAELTAEARATQAWADAMRKYPDDKPYVHPNNDLDRYDFFTGRAQAMRNAAKLAEDHNIACIDEPTDAGHWLEFALALPSGTRKVVVPDLYVLLYVFESAEWIVAADPPVCADGAQANWDAANARPIDKAEATGHESWSERSKYEALEQFAAMKDLRTAQSYVHC